jgi:hypothetical protein
MGLCRSLRIRSLLSRLLKLRVGTANLLERFISTFLLFIIWSTESIEVSLTPYATSL